MRLINKKFLLRTIVLYFIFCFICSIFIISHAYCSEDNPYCTDDQDRIQELTDEFMAKYGDEVEIRYSETTGIPTRVSHIYPSNVDLENPKKTVFSFLSENSLFLGIDDMDDLKFKEIDELSRVSGYKVEYSIFYQDVPLQSSSSKVSVNISENSDGRIRFTVVKSAYIPCIDLDVDPSISEAKAANVVKKDLGVSRLFNAIRKSPYSSYGGNNSSSFPYGFYANLYNSPPSPYPYTYNSPITPSPYSYSSRYSEEAVEPDLIIYDKDGEVYLAWKFYCSKEASGGQGYRHYYYYIDAHTGDIIDNYELKPYSSSGVDTTSSNNSIYDIYSPYNPTYNAPYNMPNTPYTPYDPIGNPYNTPYGTPYTPYSPSIGGDWFPGNSFNLMPNYTIFSNNNYFPQSGNVFQPTLSSSNRGLESNGNFVNGGAYNPFLGGANYFPQGAPFSYMQNPFYGFPY